ncbi:DUF7919 family protein [Streptomyces fructofermentans]|uniref:DUF7919 family protein n=1 Tax=Streptomyces fructofermentans TaxID=152141 RepID=UPI0033E8B6C7
MTYYADLTPYTYGHDMAQPGPGHWRGMPEVNVGWLERGRSHPKEAASADLVEALKRMTSTHRAQQTRGHHFCPWCAERLAGKAGAVKDCAKGSAEIRVPGDGVAYAAPELVAHYVEAHDYLPPAGFVLAVLAAAH